MRIRLLSVVLATMLLIMELLAGAGAAAAGRRRRDSSSERAWRIGTYVLGAGSIAALASGRGTIALIGGGATLLSYTQWRKEMKRRRRRNDLAAYRAYRTRWLRKHRGRRVRVY